MISPEIIASLGKGSEIIVNAGLYDEANNPIKTYQKVCVVTEVLPDGVNAATVFEDGRLAMPGGLPLDIIAELTGRVWTEQEIQQGFAWIFDR